ncbi:MAG: PP2C family protein-serine/threonine phosphatase [Acidobacteria bacterium]|nr:PP2C family protein-serine/threonine phosphatase [Acidobacteriota bacterium]
MSALSDPARPARTRAVQLLAAWALAAAAVGATIGAAVGVVSGTGVEWWFVQKGVLVAETVLASALVASRLAIPLLSGLPAPLRYGVMLLTLVGGALAATGVSIADRMGVVFTRPASVAWQFGANSVLALVVGGAIVAWDSLQARLERTIAELRRRETMAREVELARQVQEELLPRAAPDLPGYELVFSSRQAGMLGGDTFDFVRLPGGAIALSIGDVMGKGVAAALLMAGVQTLFETLATAEPDPARLNAALSAAVASRTRSGRYVTFAYVALDPSSGRLSYSLAGHPFPLVAGPRGVRALEEGGLPLGMAPGIPYGAGETVLEPGESLVLYTDGLVEAPAAADPDDEFGRARVAVILRDGHGLPARELMERLLAAHAAHAGDGPLTDDTTLVLLRRLRAETP